MKKLITLPVVALILYACGGSDKQSSNGLPPLPGPPETVKQSVIGKTFTTEKVAYISPFATDKGNPYEWMDGKKDSSGFTLRFVSERIRMKMNFKDDKTVALTDDDKTRDVAYRFDTITGPTKQKSKLVLILSIPDSTIQIPGITGPVMMTHAYPVIGADDKSLFLETPRSFNNQKVVILMKSNK